MSEKEKDKAPAERQGEPPTPEPGTAGAAPAPAAAPPAGPPSPDAQKIAELEDRYRRALADLANTHKRFQKERERIGQSAVAGFVKKLLPALDGFAHSLQAARTARDAKAVADGFRVIEAQFNQVLAEHGIHVIDARGKRFDPEFHHALMQDPTDKAPPGTVTDVLARGFVMGDHVIRPAQVKVAVAPAKPPEKP